MLRTLLMTTAAITVLSAPSFAEEAQASGQDVQTSFSRTIGAIKDWFGPGKEDAAQPVIETDTAAADEDMQVPPQPGVQEIEPAAGFDDDLLQVPPPYVGPQSDATRATAFENKAIAAFNDPVAEPSAADIANIAPAAGEGVAADMSQIDCASVLKAAESQEEGADLPDTAIIEACETTTNAAGEPITNSAQPALNDNVPAMPQALPETQPAAGEPPIGGAVMPGAPAQPQD